MSVEMSKNHAPALNRAPILTATQAVNHRFSSQKPAFTPGFPTVTTFLDKTMKYANQLWQADTMFGPQVESHGHGRKQTKLIAFIDDASRVLWLSLTPTNQCHFEAS